MGILKETIKFYKEKKHEEKLRKMLINHKTDFGLLEQLIQKCNDNPDLRVDINLRDGTNLHLRCYQHKEIHDLINGDNLEIE